MQYEHACWALLVTFVLQLAVLAARCRCGRESSIHANDLYFNAANWRSLPPVDCPLLIKVNGKVLRASRTNHIEQPTGDMQYVTDSGRELVGRFDWTYP